ncbi:MAG: hypothetical protein QY328_17335 [Anaerolineales bacterium]|nr:MAG: hypothetical protein QY328_17335 [Anaerolineales bacterium]
MSLLELNLSTTNGTVTKINLTAEEVIETDLMFGPDEITLPTLISVERILEQISNYGFEVLDFSESEKIASFIQNKYLPILKRNWDNQTLFVLVNSLSLSPQQYQDVRIVRNSVIEAAKQISHYQSNDDKILVKRAQDEMANSIIRTVKKEPSWWDKHKGDIFKHVVNTTLGVLINSLIGIPIGSLITGALNKFFE